jgi:DNA polymerase III delta prime subunit
LKNVLILKNFGVNDIGMESWIDKFKPTRLSEVLGDRVQIERVDKFVKQFLGDKRIEKPNLIISGTNGIGKTLIVDLVLKENGIEKITGDLSNISINLKTRKKKTTKELICTNKTIVAYYKSLKNGTKFLSNRDKTNNKIALVFDDVSNISNPKEKEAIKAIIQTNNKFQEFPIIIIANSKHSKTVNELKKLVTYNVKNISHTTKRTVVKKITNEVILKPPSYHEMKEFIKKICSAEKLHLDQSRNNSDIYTEIIEHSQYDVRRMINILEELKLIYNDSMITLDKFNKYCSTSKTKDLDPGIHEATRMLLNKYTNIDSALVLYGEERATIPLMVHENYLLNIRQQYPKMPMDEQINMMFDISKSISESDKIDGIIYSNQCWNLQPVHGFYSCVMPSYYINKKPGKLCKREFYKYTQDYNKTSIKKINNKVIKKAQEHWSLKNVTLYDFLYIASILRTLMERKELEKIAELMKPYGLKIKEIESIIKIDKVKKPKSMFTSKQRSLLKDLLASK